MFFSNIWIIAMNWLNYYQQMKYELDILEVRLKMIKQYEKNLEAERSQIENTIYVQSKLLNKIEMSLNTPQRIEFKLLKEIVMDGSSVTKAIEKIALEESKDESTLWRYYYPKVKEKIANLQAMKD